MAESRLMPPPVPSRLTSVSTHHRSPCFLTRSPVFRTVNGVDFLPTLDHDLSFAYTDIHRDPVRAVNSDGPIHQRRFRMAAVPRKTRFTPIPNRLFYHGPVTDPATEFHLLPTARMAARAFKFKEASCPKAPSRLIDMQPGRHLRTSSVPPRRGDYRHRWSACLGSPCARRTTFPAAEIDGREDGKGRVSHQLLVIKHQFQGWV